MGSVKYLLDTHTLLWAVQKDVKLSKNALKVVDNTDELLFVSAVSAYEIMYKHKLGKLAGYSDVAEKYFEILNELGVRELPVSAKHAHFAGKFEWTHRDPFDRLLVAQVVTDDMTLITNDPAFQELTWVNVLW